MKTTENTTNMEQEKQEKATHTTHTTKEYKDIVPTLAESERAFLGGFLFAKLTDLRMRA